MMIRLLSSALTFLSEVTWEFKYMKFFKIQMLCKEVLSLDSKELFYKGETYIESNPLFGREEETWHATAGVVF
uniref:Uncharacterized protein n=1 Tax=Megaselia scalaris TaxID=36166 RepID=T1GVI4_MEGSC